MASGDPSSYVVGGNHVSFAPPAALGAGAADEGGGLTGDATLRVSDPPSELPHPLTAIMVQSADQLRATARLGRPMNVGPIVRPGR